MGRFRNEPAFLSCEKENDMRDGDGYAIEGYGPVAGDVRPMAEGWDL